SCLAHLVKVARFVTLDLVLQFYKSSDRRLQFLFERMNATALNLALCVRVLEGIGCQGGGRRERPDAAVLLALSPAHFSQVFLQIGGQRPFVSGSGLLGGDLLAGL